MSQHQQPRRCESDLFVHRRQPKQRPECADGRQVGDELFLAGLDGVHHLEGGLAGILDAVLQTAHAGRHDPAEVG